MIEIVPVRGHELVTYADELAALLVDTVDGGSSVGFLAPLDREVAHAAGGGSGPGPSTRAASRSGSPATRNGSPGPSPWTGRSCPTPGTARRWPN